ncbi:hypothetical protein [Bradyrhizobium sp. th.b2]|uniref:hypothetical protein n=1 Tax=Bradyrhizobium sp. th-b2 TaxID=172088 RepID=UPI00048B645C|nr:hypothetical protein [Bradyrhizobium sp. th.b2]
MNAIERTERIKSLVRIAVAILRSNDVGGYLDLPEGGRVRSYEFRFNEMALSLRRRVDDDAQEATLIAPATRAPFDGRSTPPSRSGKGLTKAHVRRATARTCPRRFDVLRIR